MAGEMKISLKAARANRRILQKDAAKAVGITADHLKRIEAGTSDPKFTTVVKLADLYEIPITSIFVPEKSPKSEA